MLCERDEALMGGVRSAQALLRVRAQLRAQQEQGYHLLAAARYKLGFDRVSASQLPGVESEHAAAWRVVAASEDGGRLRLEAVEPAPKDARRLFGVLLPQEMQMAQQAFRKAAALAVEVANLQNDLAHFQRLFEMHNGRVAKEE